MNLQNPIRKRTLFLVTLLFFCCMVVMVSLRPQYIKCTPVPPSATQEFTGHEVIDLGAVMRVEDLAWKNSDGLLVVASSGTPHLWIYYCGVSERSAEQRTMISLRSDEFYCSVTVLSDETAAIVTNRRLIYLDESLRERRSVYLHGLSGIQEAALNPSGSILAYTDPEGLSFYTLSDHSVQALVSSSTEGSKGVPVMLSWIDDQTVAYRTPCQDGVLDIGISPIHEGQSTYWDNCGASAAVGTEYAGIESNDNPSVVHIKELQTNRDVSYEIPNHALCALLEGNNALFPITLDTKDGTLFFNRIDFSGGAFTTLFTMDAGNGSLNTRTLRLSPSSRLAVELYPQQEGNAQILVVDMSLPI